MKMSSLYKRSSRILAMFLAFVMVFMNVGSVAMTAYADELSGMPSVILPSASESEMAMEGDLQFLINLNKETGEYAAYDVSAEELG